MSALIFCKLTEAQQLMTEARQEELEGAALAAKIGELQRESDRLLKSAREKHVIGSSQFEASKALAKEQAIALGELVEEPGAAAPAKKRGRKKVAQSAPVEPGPGAPGAKAKGKGGKTAKDVVIVAKEPKDGAKVSKNEGKGGKDAKDTKPKEAKPRVVRGPLLHEKIKIVMGSKEMTIQEVIDALRAHDRSWVPKSRDLGAYISLVLSTHLEDHFDRVRRGVYKVKRAAGPAASGTTASTPPAPPKPATPPNGPGVAKTKGKREKESHGPSNGTSNGLEELGSDVMESPFSGAEAAA